MSQVIEHPQIQEKKLDGRSVTWFKAGQSGNPSGKPVGTRNKLQGDFFKRLSEDFRQHGKEAIEQVRITDPTGYIRVIASLMPKEFQLTKPLDDVSDEQLDAAYIAVRAILAAQDSGSGEELQSTPQPAQVIQTVSETD